MSLSTDVVTTVSAVQSVLALVITVGLGIVTYKVQRQQTEIARQQAATNRLQYRLALFDRRMKVFDAVTDLLGEIFRNARINLDQLNMLARETRDRELLFGPEIKEYIDEIFSNGVDLHTVNVSGLRNQAEIERHTELLRWFVVQIPVATQKFLIYLDFREP